MTHRDELLALRARLHALKREMNDVRAENDLLRDAHTQRALEAEALRRELASARDAPDEPTDDDAWLYAPEEDDEATEATEPSIPAPLHVRPEPIDRTLPAVLAAGMLLMGAMTAAGLSALHAARPTPLAVPPMAVSDVYVTPLSRPGTVIATRGVNGLALGDSCTVVRHPVDVGPFDCRVTVECDGRLLYGVDENTGYMQCGGREWVRDSGTTAEDGDPAVIFDVALDLVTVEDDGWMVRIRI
ncbi:MAG: hypothetical protein KC619_34590 [Myxococcales bacterium]|nr:hypothetical protein [Myxococcales bacterium]